MGIVGRAFMFATYAHRNQVRKYTGEPYTKHLAEVATEVELAGYSEETIAAAWLHDCREDQEVSDQLLDCLFGRVVAKLVNEVTDRSKPTDGNRAVRKRIDREWLAKASAAGKTIKLADLLSNTASIVKYDPNFAKVYLAEKRLLLPHLAGGDVTLFRRAFEQLEIAEHALRAA